jgi:Domain of unknown function (DUF4136)
MKLLSAIVMAMLLTTGVALGINVKNVKTELKRPLDLRNVKRFAVRNPTLPGNAAALPASLYEERLREALVAELDAQRFQFVPADNADFLVSCYASDTENITAESDVYPQDETTAGSLGPNALLPDRHRRGSIVVEVFDLDQKLIWRGRIDRLVKVDPSGSELDQTRVLVDRFMTDMGQKPSY